MALLSLFAHQCCVLHRVGCQSLCFLDAGSLNSTLPAAGNNTFFAWQAARRLEAQATQDGADPALCVAMSLLAGISTTLGAAVVYCMPGGRVSPEHMSFVLALAGGVMLSCTILEFWLPMFVGGKQVWPVVLYSGLGAAAFFILSWFVPEPEMVEGVLHAHGVEDMEVGDAPQKLGRPPDAPVSDANEEAQLVISSKTVDASKEEGAREMHRRWRLVFVLMASLTAHNFPEGFAVAISALESNRLGLVVMVAIALHNIPEGIAIAVPVFAATGSHRRCLWMSFLSGMAEPLGAITALVVVRAFGGSLTENAMEDLLCAVGGVMCAVALKELLPEAWRQGRPRMFFLGLVGGFCVMWLTRLLGA